MRKHQQQQILGLLKTIEQAQSERLYADCQAGAVAIGGFIESIVGEGTKTVALLEEYCELLFKASKGEIKEKLLRKHLIKIENSVMFDLKPNRIEIVFLPYKVSMWDSLESIYLAAKSDSNCDAYVVPIPSYELNPDGTLGKMYYDGDQYPKDIPVVDWQTYDIEARHPDVIFIHYAYDDNVSNATIHPDFYSKRLREHCELLVYVPYFVAVEDTVDEYCGYLPGVLYAHHVIAQSEAVRQSYIGHYKKCGKELGWKGRFGKAEEKFVALGSPKFDKVINTRREDYELPEEWKRLIYKTDGSRKKVVLYNTHMFAWINGGEAYFKKLRSVFDLFRSRDDVVLWWRPHPNTELNFRTKRPERLGEYKVLVDYYKRGSWGIYDDTPDLHRAIAWGDAYYGDGSSLVALYQVKGKPKLLQRTELISDAVSTPCFHYICGRQEYSWAADNYVNAFYRIDNRDLSVQLMGRFPQVFNFQANLFGKPQKYGDTLVFPPFNANKFISFDISENKFSMLDFEKNLDKNATLFWFSLTYQDKIIFIPYRYSALVIYDISSAEFKEYRQPIDFIIQKYGPPQEDGYYFNISCVIDDVLYMSTGYNFILAFNIIDNKTEIIEIPEANGRITDLKVDGDCFWAVTGFGVLYQYDTTSKRFMSEINISENHNCFFDKESAFYLVVREDDLLFFGRRQNVIISMGKKTKTIKYLAVFGDFSNNNICFDCPEPISDGVIAYNEKSSALVKVSGEKAEVKSGKAWTDEFSDTEIGELSNYIVTESKGLTLQTFLKYIVENSAENNIKQFDKAGERIYGFIKQRSLII